MPADRIALVTNAGDFAGPPAVDALLADGYRVLAHDPAFARTADRDAFLARHPGAETAGHAEPDDLVAWAWDQAGAVDVVVSNDHYPAIHVAVEDAAADDLRATLEALVVWPFRLAGALAPRFKAQGRGAIVMITSCRTRLPRPGGAIPDAARDANNALVRSLSIDLAPFGIPVNAVAPNYLYSEAYYPRAKYIDDPAGAAFVRQIVPAGRLAEPAEIGEVIRFLAAARTPFLTGAIIDFAGGWPAAPMPPA